jgi:hypothetical protein
MTAILLLGGVLLRSLPCVAADPPLDVDTLSSVMDKVMAKQQRRPVPCVCQDGSGQVGLVETTNPASGIYFQSCLSFVLQGNGLPPIPVTCARFTYVPN